MEDSIQAFEPVAPVTTNGSPEEYVSLSTIDSPPNFEDAKQPTEEEDFKQPRPSDMYVGERLFEVEFSVTLKPTDGKSIKIPLLVDKMRGTIIEEAMAICLGDARNVRIIQAVLDNPKDRIRSGEAHPDAEKIKKQTELF